MRKATLSIVLTLILFLTFGTTTLAWISLPRTNVIDDISFNARTSDGLEISLDGINYSDNIEKEALMEIIRNVKFSDVTSRNGIDFKQGYTESGIPFKNKDYLSIDVYFRSKSNRRSIYLANNLTRQNTSYENLSEFKDETFIISKGVDQVLPVTYLHGPNSDDLRTVGSSYKYYGSDAIRVSSVEQSPNANYELEDPIVKIFDLSENRERGYGKPYGALSYFETVMGLDELSIPAPPETIYELTSFDEYNIPNNDQSLITFLRQVDDSGYFKAKATINIWIEGWDADAFDVILGDNIKIQLAFKVY